MNSGKKIIYVDLDETLLTSDKKICDANVKAINKMMDAGHVFAVNTGRPLNAVKKIIQGVNRGKNCYFLTFHGTNVYECASDKVVQAKAMDNKAAIELLKAIDEAGIYAHTFTSEGIYTKRDDEVLAEYNKYTNEPVTVVESFDELEGLDLYKIMAIDFNNHEVLADFQREHMDMETGVFNSFFSCPQYLEYTLAGADKGDGVRFLADYLDVPMENTIACGDERNDISMIKAAGLGVAMVNANPEAKKVAGYITENDNNNGGIAEVIDKFILQNS